MGVKLLRVAEVLPQNIMPQSIATQKFSPSGVLLHNIHLYYD